MPEVLICGEDPAALQSLKSLLLAEGFQAESFSHLSEAVTPCLRGKYKLAVISLGFRSWADAEERLELIRMLRRIAPGLPIVVVSDPEGLEMERELRSLGIFYLLTTPLSATELRDVVQCAIRKETARHPRGS